MLNHDHIGAEHILLGLVHEREGIAGQALESLGVGLEPARRQVREIIGQGQQAPSGHIPFTPRAKKVLELSLREALQLGHNYIGTEHILLGLMGEGESVAAQVLVRLGAEPVRVRRKVIQLLLGSEAESARAGRGGMPARVESRLDALEGRLTAIERNVGTGPDTKDLDEQIERVRGEKESAAAAQEYERAASLRDKEKQLLASRVVRQEEWAANHSGLRSLAEQCQQLGGEIERLRALLRQHGIDAEDLPA